MYRACELKDQTYKKTRTLHSSDLDGQKQTSWPLPKVAKRVRNEFPGPLSLGAPQSPKRLQKQPKESLTTHTPLIKRVAFHPLY